MNLKNNFRKFLIRFPTISSPNKKISIKEKIIWTFSILILYFILSNIPIFGMSSESIDLFESYRAFFAGSTGSIIAIGISPIVTASIILQLLVSSNIIKLNLSDVKNQTYYQKIQKLLVILMIIFESLPQLFGYIKPNYNIAYSLGIKINTVLIIIFLQMFIGGLLILFMDEIISKWGIGSGISIFIVASVSQQLINGIINWTIGSDGLSIGLIPKWISLIKNNILFTNDWTYFLLHSGILSLISTITIFLFVVYIESIHIDIPLTHNSIKGTKGSYPVKLIYASVLPMIFVRALQANIQIIGTILSNKGFSILGVFHNSIPINGLMYYLSPINSPYDWLPILVSNKYLSYGYLPPSNIKIIIHLIIDAIFLLFGGIFFALFWIETTGMNSKSIANKIISSGLQIPGFRRSINAIEKMMDRYIPKVTILGGFLIGFLTLFSSLLGTIGSSGGTGLLLTVSIIYKLYENIAKEKSIDDINNPIIQSLFESLK